MGDLMTEPRHLLDEVDPIRRAMAAGDRETVSVRLKHLVSHLERHVSREEDGIFTALRRQGDYADATVDATDRGVTAPADGAPLTRRSIS